MAYDLPALIRQIPEFSAKTPEECREYFAEAPVTLKTARYNGNDLMKLEAFGNNSVTVANALASALQSAGYVLIVGQLTTESGIDFGDEKTQAMLTTLGQNQTFAPYVALLKALGQDTRTRWSRAGGSGELPSVEEIAAAKTLIALQSAWATAMNEQFTALVASGDSSGLKSALLAFAEAL